MILVWHTKYGEVYYSASTDAEYEAACLDMLGSRVKQCYICEGDDHYDDAVKALESKDGPVASRIIEERDGYEYEGVSVEVVKSLL